MERKIFLIFLIIFISVPACSQELPTVNIEKISPLEPAPGETFTVTVSLEGGQDSFSSEPVEVETVEGIRYTGTTSGFNQPFRICSGCRKVGKLYFRAEKGTYTGKYPVKLIFKGSGDVGIVENFDVDVEGRSKLTINSGIVEAVPGEKGELSFTIRNVGTDTASDIVLKTSNSHFSTEPSELEIGSLNPGNEFSGKLSFVSDENTETGLRQIGATITYREDSEETQESSNFNLKLLEKSELALEDFKVDQNILNRLTTVTVEIENLGPGEAERIRSELDCEGAKMEVSKSFVGQLNDDESVPMVFEIVPLKENVECSISTSYTDVGTKTLVVDNSFRFEPERYTRYYVAGALFIVVLLLYFYNRRKEDELEEV